MILFHEPAVVGTCLAITVTAALTDAFTRKIPNLLTAGGFLFGLVANGAIGFVEAGARGALHCVALSFGGALLCALLPFISFVRRQIGGGDVKLFAAIGAMVGPALGLDVQFMTLLFAAFVMFPITAIRSGFAKAKFRQLRALLRGEKLEAQPAVVNPRVILAPSILLGFCVAMLRNGALTWT